MELSKKLSMKLSRNIASVLMIMLPCFIVLDVSANQDNKVKEVTWEQLMPKVDQKVLSQYEAGELSREEAMDYVDKLGEIPVQSLDQKRVRIPGFLVPLNIDKNQMATELLLVPNLGACVHTPPPPPNQTVYVRFNKGIKVTEAGYTPYWLEGTIQVEKNKSEYTETLYGMTVTSIEEYE